MKRCKRCLIPVVVPGVELSPKGVCNLCRIDEQGRRENSEAQSGANESDLEETLATLRGTGEYDCLVPLSGGKDSVYLLYKLKTEYDLRILAFTTDVNIPDIAWENIKRSADRLEIDHIVYRPPEGFYRKLFRYLLSNQEKRGAVYSVSYVYAPLFEGDAIKLASEKQIPLILAGYSPGQPDPGRMLYEFSRELIETVDWTPPGLKESAEFTESELGRFFNPATYPMGTIFPRYLAPFHAWEYDQEMITRKVVELGLVATSKHASPIHSNYPINWLLMYSDLKKFGYNPYAPEFAALIREGKANRNYWRVMMPVVDFLILNRLGPGKEVTRSLRWLGLSEGELRITKPQGAYDPVLPSRA